MKNKEFVEMLKFEPNEDGVIFFCFGIFIFISLAVALLFIFAFRDFAPFQNKLFSFSLGMTIFHSFIFGLVLIVDSVRKLWKKYKVRIYEKQK
jgi:hypothetical protein